MLKGKLIKVLGFAATFIGVGASLLSEWVNEKKIEDEIEKKVEQAIAERYETREES